MKTGKEHQGEGILEQAKGAIKEGFGALTGNRSKEAEGKADRTKGKVQEKYGEIKSDIRGEDDLNRPPR